MFYPMNKLMAMDQRMWETSAGWYLRLDYASQLGFLELQHIPGKLLRQEEPL